MAKTAPAASPYTYRVAILVPMFNEAGTILFVLNKIKRALGDKEFQIIVVDDGSTDGSAEQVRSFMALNPHLAIEYFYQPNQGKGSAIRSGIAKAQAEILVVQDADLEYEPSDIPNLLAGFNDQVQVVYGSRNLNQGRREHSSALFYWGGIAVTLFTNFLFGSKLTDEATGYKLFKASVFDKISFKHNDFAWEPEITAKILKMKLTIVERPISYTPRSRAEGKKISWRDGVKAFWVLFVEFLQK